MTDRERRPRPRMLTPEEVEDLRAETKRNVAYFKRLIGEKRADHEIEPLVTYSDRPRRLSPRAEKPLLIDRSAGYHRD